MEQPKELHPLLSVKEVMALLQCSESTVKKLVREKKLARPRRGTGKPRWTRKDLEVFFYRLETREFEMPKTRKKEKEPGASRRKPAPGG